MNSHHPSARPCTAVHPRLRALARRHELIDQTRIIATVVMALALLLFAAAARAEPPPDPGLVRKSDIDAGALLLKTSTPGLYLPAPTVATDVQVDVGGLVERTRVTQRFENPSDQWVEGVYLFPLPETAAVDTLKIQIGDRFVEGQIKEKKEARQIYETAKANGQKASLVEEQRPNMFTNSVANIGPHETIVVQMEFQGTVRLDNGQASLTLPLVVAPRYSPPARVTTVNFDGQSLWNASDPVLDRHQIEAPVLRPETKVNPVTLTISLDAGFPLGDVESPSHKIAVARNGASKASVTLASGQVPADKDFVLNWRPKPGAEPTAALLSEEHDGKHYLMALVVPPTGTDVPKPQPREEILVLDNSGSMGGESIRQAKESLLFALDQLGPKDRFNVIRFDDTLTVLFPMPVDVTEETIAKAKAYVSSLDANGGTEMLPALKAALADATPTDQSHVRQVIFLTDGAVGNEAELFNAVARGLGRSRVFTVGIGSAPNGYFMTGLARAGRGTYTYISAVDQVKAKMTELFGKLSHPVMTNLVAQWSDSTPRDVSPERLPDLYAGEPVVLTAEQTDLRGKLTLAGNLAGRPWVAVLDLAKARPVAGIEKLWARNKIAALEDRRVMGEREDTIDPAVLKTALDHHLVSRLTSLVAVDVTPSRPSDTPVARRDVPLNLPEGWDFDKVFGEQADTRRADIDAMPKATLASLATNAAPTPAPKSEEPGLALPQGATDARLFILAGMILMLMAAALFALGRERAGGRS